MSVSPWGFLSVYRGFWLGKSTLVNQILGQALSRHLYRSEQPGDHDRIEGLNHLEKVVVIDQTPIGRTPVPTQLPTPVSLMGSGSFSPRCLNRASEVTVRAGLALM